LFIPVWWSWIGTTYYTARFEAEVVSYRLFIFLQMVAVAAMAVFAHDALGETSTGFALAYAGGRALVTIMWVRGGLNDKRFMPVSRRYLAGFSISIALFVASVFVPPPLKFVMWGIGLFMDLVTPWTTVAIVSRLPRFSPSKLPERFGLFTIVALGESIVGAVSGVARNQEVTLGVGITGLLGLALAFCVWWLYFEFVARRPPKPGLWWQIGWAYLHLPLVISIAATGASLPEVVGSAGQVLPAEVRWLVTGAVAASLVVIGLLELVLRPSEEYRVHPGVSSSLKFAGALGAFLIGALGGQMAPSALLILLILLLLVEMAYGAYILFRQEVPTVRQS
jgi:low temperature requirement protein LtrA